MRRSLAVVASLAVLGAATGGYLLFSKPSPGAPVSFEVLPGATTTDIAADLAQARIIGSTWGFRVVATLRRLDGKIQAGRYELQLGMGVHAALDVLAQPPNAEGVAVQIPEGFTIDQMAERVAAATEMPTDAFVAAASDGSIRPDILPDGIDLLEGLLFPETYLVTEQEQAADLVQRMADEFEARTADLDWGARPERTPYETVIIASLIEREARVDEDRAKISAVIHNRLAIGMRLQIDITALYGLDQHKVPSRRDLRRESAYNTYLIDGLPPTPIASPGRAALEAALHPADIDAIFYVVIDASGKHGFTSSPSEFEELKKRRPDEVRGG